MTQRPAVLPKTPGRDRTPSFSPRIAILLAASALVVMPTVIVGQSASAAEAFSVLTPQEGSTVSYVVPTFSGLGINAGDTVSLTYVGIADPTASATKFVGEPTVAEDGTWSTPTNFEELAPDQTTIVVTATELDADGSVIGTPVVRTFNTDRATNLTFPFAVSSPTTLEVVASSTPIATGSAAPGDEITVSYGNLDASVTVAGTATAGRDGMWSAPLDLSGVVLNDDGTLNNLGLTVERISADGSIPAEAVLTVTVQYQPAAVTPDPEPEPTSEPEPTPDPKPTPEPSATPMPSPSPSNTATPTPGAGSGNDNGNGRGEGELAETGAHSGPLLGGAALLLAAGSGFLLIRRRLNRSRA